MDKNVRRTTVIVVVITAFITTFTGSALNLSVPDIGDEFGVSAASVGWLITGYTLAVAAFSVPLGRLADITCRRTVLAVGIGLFTACCIAAVFAASAGVLIGVRIVQGVSAAMVFSTNTAVLLSAFPGNMSGRVIGYSLASTYVGLSSGPVIGGILNYQLGWRAIFVLTGVLSVAAFIAVMKLPAEAGNRERQAPLSGQAKRRNLRHTLRLTDPAGSLLYMCFIVLLMYGLSKLGKGWLPPVCVGLGLIIGVLFIRRELIAENPVVNVRLFRENIGYAFSNLSALLNYGATFAISYLISIYLQVVSGYSSQSAGIIMIAQPGVMAALSPLVGRISDKVSPFRLSSVGMALCAAGTGIFAFIGEGTGLVIIVAALLVTGLGFALFSSPNTNAVMSCVDEKEYGVASSILATMRSIGHTMSMVVVTVIVSRYMGDAPLAQAGPDTVIRVIHTSFLIFTGVCAAGVFISLKRGRPTDRVK